MKVHLNADMRHVYARLAESNVGVAQVAERVPRKDEDGASSTPTGSKLDGA